MLEVTVMSKQLLADFIADRRRELRLPRDEVAARAKRAGHDLSGSYIAKIENRETGPAYISVAKLEALAAGLGVGEEDLFHIARGESPKPVEPKPAETGRMLALIDDLAELAYPLTPEERAILERADRMRMRFDTFHMPGFWNKTPQERRRLFRDIENVIDEMQDLMGEMG